MPTINPLDLQTQIAEILQALVERHADPMELAVAAWNASFEYEQGDKNAAND